MRVTHGFQTTSKLEPRCDDMTGQRTSPCVAATGSASSDVGSDETFALDCHTVTLRHSGWKKNETASDSRQSHIGTAKEIKTLLLFLFGFLHFFMRSWKCERVLECLERMVVFRMNSRYGFFPEKLSFKIFPEESARHPHVPAGICWNKMYSKMKFHKRKSLIPTSPSIAQSVCDIPPPLISVHLHELLNAFHGHVVSWSRQFSSAMHPLPCR